VASGESSPASRTLREFAESATHNPFRLPAVSVTIPGKAGGFQDVSRQRRHYGAANAAPLSGPTFGGPLFPQPELILARVFAFLRLDVLANHRLVSTYGRDIEAARPEMLADEVLLPFGKRPGQIDRALPLMYRTTCDTAYFGGIDRNMCTWSGIRWPSSTRPSFCSANVRNTAPNSLRTCP